MVDLLIRNSLFDLLLLFFLNNNRRRLIRRAVGFAKSGQFVSVRKFRISECEFQIINDLIHILFVAYKQRVVG